MANKKSRNRKIRMWAMAACSLFVIFYIYGVPLALKYFIPQLIEKKFEKYEIAVECSEVTMNGLSTFCLKKVRIDTEKAPVIVDGISIDEIEIKCNIFNYFINGAELLQRITVAGIEVDQLEDLSIPSELSVTGFGTNEFRLQLKGNLSGQLILQKQKNLTWQINLFDFESNQDLDIWHIAGSLKQSKDGSIVVDTEIMFPEDSLLPYANINLSWEQVAFKQLLPASYTKYIADFSEGKLSLKGDLGNLNKFTDLKSAFLSKELYGNAEIRNYYFEGPHKKIRSQLTVRYEDNVFESDLKCEFGQSRDFSVSCNITKNNDLFGEINGSILELQKLTKDKLLEDIGFSGDLILKGIIGGTMAVPEVDLNLLSNNLVYGKTKLNFNFKSYLKGHYVRIPVVEISSPNKFLRIESEFEIKDISNFKVHINEFNFGEKEHPFRLTDPIEISINHSKVFLYTYQFTSKKTKIGGYINLLENGLGSLELSLNDFRIKELCDFFNFPLAYNIDGNTNAKINIRGSLTDPHLSLAGSIEDLKVHGIPGGVSTFEIKADSKGLEVISFDLNHKIENSSFHLDGYIPIKYDASNFIIKEDTLRERSFYTVCHNTSPKFLSGILPKVESLEGRLSGKLNSYKLAEKRYFTGKLELDGGEVSFKTNLSPLTDIKGSIEFQRKKIIINKMSGKMGQGALELDGELLLSDLIVDSLNLKFKGKNLKVINDEDLLLILSPDLTYTGSVDSPLLKGSIYVDKVKYDDHPQNLADKINTFRNPTTEFDIWPRTELDIDLRCDHNAYNTIKQSSYSLQGSGKLSIKGYVANSEINGYLRIEKGRIPVYSKEFIVQGGIVRLENDLPPFINFSADYKSSNVDVKMKINQYADELINVEYTSIPALTEDDLQRFLINNLLPGQEGEGIDLISFVKTSLDYSDVLSTQGLQWLKRFSFETRTRNRNGQEEFGITVEYVFDEPEWFSVKAIQDDDGIFNFFLVASFNFLGFTVDKNIYVIEDFDHLSPRQIGELLTRLESYDEAKLIGREKNEFDIQYVLRILNYMVQKNDLEQYIKLSANHEQIGAYTKIVNQKKDKIKKSKKNISVTSLRKYNRKIIDLVFEEHFVSKKKKKGDKKKDRFLNKRIMGKGLKRKQRKVLRTLLKDEMTSYFQTKKISFLKHAAFKIKRVCDRWGYKDSAVSWKHIEGEYLDKKKTVLAVKFLINLGPRFRLKDLYFKGVNELKVKELTKYLKFKPSKPTVPFYYSKSYTDYLGKQVRGYFLNAGYLDVKTSIGFNSIKGSKRNIAVTIKVMKGKLYKVSNVEFFGNMEVSKAKIFKNVLKKLRANKIIDKDAVSIEGAKCHSILLTKLKNYISEFYKNQGYYNCRVKARIKQKYEFVNLSSFVPPISFEEFKNLMSEKTGLFSFEELFKSKTKLRSLGGYYLLFNEIVSRSSLRWKFIQNFSKVDEWHDSSIKPLYTTVLVDRDKNHEMLLVRKIWSELYFLPKYKEVESKKDKRFVWQFITCSVNEGIQYRFGKVIYKPRYVKKFKTLKRIIKKQIKVKSGTVYNIKDVRESIQHLTRLGVFREVDYVEKIRDDKIDVEFILRENKSLSLEIQTGYGEFDRVQAGVRLFDHNIFGTTRSLGVKGRASTKSWLLEPIFESRFFWGFRNQWIGIFETNISDEFTSFRSGFETNLTKSFDYGVNLSFGYKFESNTAKDVVEELNQEETGFVIFSGTQLKFSINEVDSLLLPHKGYYFKFGGESNFKAFGSSFDIVKAEMQYTHHIPFSDRITFSLGGRLGAMKLISGSDEIPLQVKLFSGGGNTVRGYEHNSLGPLVDGANIGGELRGIFNSEFRFPLTLTGQKQYGVLFFDSGFLETSAEDLDDVTWDSAIGFGYRYVSPIGPIRLDLGIGLNDRSEGISFFDLGHDGGEIQNLFIGGYKARLHLSFGFAF